uniref:Ring finger protein 183 n=1 Tax=Stegastes partitus TaxID=144197 RepID=A0A3B5A5L9_9TELE
MIYIFHTLTQKEEKKQLWIRAAGSTGLTRNGRARGSEEEEEEEAESDRRKTKPPEDDVEDTECAVCFCSYDNVFKTPKLLACGHTFCLECLARINVVSPELKTLSCPVCRELTELPHGQDLPRLGNNEDIIGKLPPDMQRALSIRFKRSKGKLMLKNPPPNSPTKPTPATVVDVGRPPSRVRGRMRRLFRSDQCYYAVVGSIITVTVVLMLVGILAFVIIPNVVIRGPPGPDSPATRPPSGNGPWTHPVLLSGHQWTTHDRGQTGLSPRPLCEPTSSVDLLS